MTHLLGRRPLQLARLRASGSAPDTLRRRGWRAHRTKSRLRQSKFQSNNRQKNKQKLLRDRPRLRRPCSQKSLARFELRTWGIGTSADLFRQQSVDDAPAGSATFAAGTLARVRLGPGKSALVRVVRRRNDSQFWEHSRNLCRFAPIFLYSPQMKTWRLHPATSTRFFAIRAHFLTRDPSYGVWGVRQGCRFRLHGALLTIGKASSPRSGASNRLQGTRRNVRPL